MNNSGGVLYQIRRSKIQPYKSGLSIEDLKAFVKALRENTPRRLDPTNIPLFKVDHPPRF